ncbi:ESPR-type extended signal peptide-containing protein [Veillonella sp. T34266-5]|uniref:ESPR-type extended signal peptide-containing protein n=2 Tax=Veillonella sp. T34266-5 TaxID=2027457 RepID=UPI000CF46AC8|nr:ESPR-type extended signal peptide-containing protein [Veillonella sp. T34266-5]PQL22911.1 Tat pathway signal protein [Veillonella sp. T34266-5]
MRKGFKGFMNKVFKVVWSKSKECYVVVPEIAKNNSGKKKVLASVLAGLAVAGAMGGIAPQQAMADADYGNSHVNVWANTAPDGSNGKNDAGQNSIVVGYQNTTDHTAGNDGKVAIGAKNSATGNSAMAMGNRNVANGGAATAIGAGNESTAATTLTVGNKNNANAENAIAIGAYNNQNWTHGSWQTTPKPAGAYSLAIGNFNDALGSRATAVGAFNTAKGEWATAIGASTVASGDGDVAIGDTTKTNATGVGHAVAVGWHAETGAANAVAVGPSALASGKNSVSVGSNNKSRVQDTVTMGQDNDAKTMGGIAIGKNNMVDSTNGGTNFGETRNENSQIAIGRDNTATHLDTIAIGRDTHATGSGATAFGARADASGNNSIAIGQSGRDSKRITASGENAIAIGMRTTSSGASSIAQGAEATATGDYAIAEGRLSKATKQGAIAIGNETEANIANGVALGDHSVTTTDKGVLGYNPSNLHDRKYKNLKGNVQTATTAAVSIGNGETLTRQLTGLAAGTADTDAVNVAQLKNVGVAVAGNTGNSDFLADGGKLNVIGTGRVSTVAAHDGEKDSKITVAFDDTGMVKAGKNVTVDEKTVNGRTTYTINAADAAAKYDFLTNAKANGGKLDGTATATKVESGQTVTYAAGKNLTVKQDINQSIGEQTYTYSLNSDLGGITSITNNGGPTLHFGDNNISVTGGNLDLGDHNITNLKSGGDVENNAANIGDVTRISKANDLHIAPTAGTNNNVAEYTVDGNKKVTLTYQDGNGKTVTGPKAVIDLSGLPTGDMSSFNVKSTATEGTVARGSQGQQAIRDGKTVEMQAGKNMTIKQTNNNGNAAVEFSLNKNVDLTPDGSLTIGDTNITDNGLTINNGPSITKTGINAGGLNITNVKAGVNDNDAVNVSQLKKVRADERHIKPGEYAVDANGKVTMTYLDGNNKDVANETAVITGIAKQDLSNINKGGETVIQNLAKKSIDMENGKNTKVSNREINGVKTFKVDVEGDLTDITSITNKDGDGKVVFGGNQTVNVAGDHNINLNAKVGDITGLTNVTLDAPDFAKKGRAATEEQLKIVNNGFNNTVGLTGNTGATDLQKLNQAGGLSFGVIGANNGQYIKTTASGSNVAVDLSDDAKSKLNNTVEVRGKNAAKVTSVTENTVDGGKKTIYTVDVDNVTPTAASTEKVKAKANVTGSTDTNIAKVTPQAGDQYGDAGATYEVNVSRNDVKDAAREAVTVNTTNTTNNPITVTPAQDETNHNTTYTVTFDGDKAAKQIPLTYKANGQNAQTVTLDKGLNFTNGKNTTASVDAEGVVKYDVNKDLVNINSISNTTNGPKMEFGPNSINITNGPINMGDQNITNLKSGGDVINNAANIGDVTRISKANDLHIAPTTSNRTGETTTSYAYDAASKSVTLKYNDGNGATQSGTVAKIDLSGLADQIKDGYSFSTDAKGNVVGNHAVTAVGNGKTVSYAAGDNLTVKQDIDNATGEHTYTYALSNNVDLTPNGSLKIGDTILNNGGLTITGGPSVTKTGINAGNLNITNVKAGVNDTDAVNVKQLKDARTVVTSNDNSVTINKTENGNQVTYDLHVAPGAAQSVWNVKSTGNTTADSETAAKTISDGKTVEMAAGKNLTVKQTSNNDGAKVEFDLANDIKIGKDGRDGVDGKIGVNGKDGSSVVINGKDGSIGLNGKDGKDGLTMKGEKGQPGLNGKDGITRIVYEDNNHDKHEVATLDDGLNFTGNNTDIVNKQKLNSLVKVQGEGVDKNTSATFKSAAGNINVKADGTDTLEVQLNKDLKNINTIKNGGNATFTIGGDNFAFNGGNVSIGGNNITNLKSGIVNNNDTDNTNAANIGDVKNISKANDLHIAPTTSNRTGETTVSYAYDTASKSVTLKYNDGNGANQAGTIAKIDLSGLADQIKDGYSFSTDAKGNVVGNHAVTAVGNGKTVSYAAGDNLTVKQDIDATTGEHTYTYALSNDIKVGKDGKDGIDGKIGVNGKDGSSVVINGKDGSIGLNGKDGKDGLTIRGEKGQDGVDGKNGTNGITRIVYEDHNNDKHEVATLDDGMKYAGDDAQGTDKSKVIAKKLNETMDVVGGADKSKLTDNNIGVNNVDGKLKVQLSKEVNLTPSGSLTIGDTVVNNSGLTISGGPSIIKTGINAGNLNITNVKAGVNDTDAVNVKQLKDARTVVTSNDHSVTVNKTENGNQVTYDLHVAPGAAQSVWNVKSTGNTTADSETAPKTISDGKTVEMAAGKNLTVKQTSNNDGAKVEFDLANDIKIGKDGRDGVDGKIGVNGKDGSSVVINGKDGSIGLNGKDGKDGLTMKGEKGADGVTRIVYEDHDNNKHEVATLDDGLRFDANSGGEKKNKLGSKVTVKGTGAKADSEYDSSNIKTSITQGADGNSEINIGLAKDLNNINTIKNGGPATFTIGGNEFKFDGGNVNMGGNNITNLKSGIVNNNSTDDTNGANIGDVKTISKANDLHIAPTTSNRAGETTTSYSYNTADKSVTLKYNDGNGANQAGTIAKIDLSGLADQIKDGYSFSTDAKGNVVGNHAVTAVGNGKTVSYAAGDNLTVKQDIDATTGEHTYTYALSNDIKVGKDGKDGVDGKIGVNGKDGSSVVINGKDGSIGLNGKDGKDGLTIRGEKGQDGVDGKNGTNGITRIVYEDHNHDKHEVATLDDGMKYAGDDAQGADKSKVIAKKLNETMDIVGGADKSKLTDNNIGVNNVDGKLKVQLSKEVNLTPSGSLTIGDTVVNNNGLTISGGPSITKTGINAGNLNITNVKAGVNDTDAVNVKQLKDARTVVTSNDNSVTVNKTENGNQVTYDLHVAPGAAQSVWKVKSTGNTTADSETAPKTISDGKTVEMAAGKNLTVKQTSNNDGAKVEFDLANDIKIGKDGRDGVDGKIGVNGKDGSSVVINGKDGSIGLNGKDGKDGLTMKGEKGQPGLNGKDGITRIVYEDNNHDKHEVATLDDGLNFTGNNTDTVNKQKLNSLVKVQGEGVDKNTSAAFKSAAGNINVKADGTDTLEVQLNKDLKNINTIKNGGPATFTIGGNEFKFDGGNVNMGGNNITNLKSGIVNNNSTDDTNGANIGDVKTISKANDIHVKDTRYTVNADKTVTLEYVDGNDKKINKTAVIDLSNLPTGGNAITYKANNQNAQTVSLDKGLNFIDGNYTKASVDADGIVKYDVTIGKVKDGVDGKPGVDGKDGIATVKTVVDTINNSGWKGDVTGNTVGNHTATIVKPGTTVNFGAGKNVTVEQIVNAVTGDHTYNYALSDDIKLGKDGKDGVDGRIGVNGKDGSSVVINGKDGSIGLNGKDGKDGLTMKAENGQPGLNGKDGITRIVYEDKNNNKHEVATLDDGLRFTGNNEVENKQKLGSLVKIKGEGVSKAEEATFESAKGNIAVTADGTDTLTVRLNKNIKGIDSIQTKEIHLGTPDNYTTIKKDGDRIKYGDKTIANTDELWTIQANGTDVPANGGKVNVKGADGITVSRTANGEMTISGSGLGTMNSFNVKSTGNTAAGSETAAKKITDGKTVEFSGGNNVTVKQTSNNDGAKVEFALKNNIDLTQDGSVKIGDTKITDGGLVINNGPSITKDGINAGNKQITNVEDGVNDTDAVNVRQLKDAKTKLVDGQNTTVTGDGSKNNPYKVNVEGDLKKITSITNNDGDGKLEFKGDQVVNVAGDNTIKLDGKTGDITSLTNKTLDSADFATKGRAATEEQLKLVQQEAAKKSTEKVQAKADTNNIAKVAPKAGDTFGAAGATYEVSVDKNDVKDVAREAVTVSGDKKAITVDVQPNATNHTTNYQVNFNGTEAAKQIPLTYKENGGNARTVMLSDGLDFTNGVNTTAHTAANGKVSFDVKGDLTNITSISNNSNGPKMSFGGDSINITGGSLNMGDNYIHNVKAGEKNTDAVNVSQLKAAKTEVEAGRNVTVEHRLGENGQDIYKVNAEAGVDPRVDKLGEEIGHVGAQSAALSALKPIQYDPMEPTQIMAGYGNYRGNSALALGVAHYKNESTMFHAGVSWAGGNGHMMANAGVTWKVGNRDSEAAVADRYRKGPISSTYAMQTEVASMKAQNAGLKGEVSDLKAENEQIKAQNAGLQSEVDQLKAQMAAMMAKLGM